MIKIPVFVCLLSLVSANATPSASARGSMEKGGELQKIVTPKGEGSSSTSSHTKRVVVVNGKTIVDEETVNGKPLKRGKSTAGDPLRKSGQSLEELLKELEREVAPKGGSKEKGTSTSSSHTRRVVVVNGETVVDEETVDGLPVRKGAGRKGVDEQTKELEELLRRVSGLGADGKGVDLEELLGDMKKGDGKSVSTAKASSSASSSSEESSSSSKREGSSSKDKRGQPLGRREREKPSDSREQAEDPKDRGAPARRGKGLAGPKSKRADR